ncbi:MAG: ParA family protein [Rhodomicrobium sp.]
MTSIAIMNAKGGVGKSTLTMAIAETLAVWHEKSVLLIDADAQMNLSLMVMPPEKLNEARRSGQSIAAWLSSQAVSYSRSDWRACVISGISDVDDASELYIIPGDMDMTLVEREIASRSAMARARQACRALLDEAAQAVDFVLVDCAPGISIVTECWLRECDWHLIPIKPDILAVSGMEYLRVFRQRNPGLGFAEHLGVLINMKDMRSPTDQMTHEFLSKDESLRCFASAIPLIQHIQKAALFMKDKRSYQNKYPGEAGRALRDVTTEMIKRVSEKAAP